MRGKATVVKNAGSHFLLSRLPEWAPFPAVLKGKIRLSGSESTNPVAVGDVVTFKLYDHDSGEELDLNCEVTATLVEDYGCIGCEYPDENLFIFAFTTPTPQPTVYEFPIEGYGAGNPGGYYLIASPVTVAPADVAGDPQGMTQGNFDLYYFDNLYNSYLHRSKDTCKALCLWDRRYHQAFEDSVDYI